MLILELACWLSTQGDLPSFSEFTRRLLLFVGESLEIQYEMQSRTRAEIWAYNWWSWWTVLQHASDELLHLPKRDAFEFSRKHNSIKLNASTWISQGLKPFSRAQPLFDELIHCAFPASLFHSLLCALNLHSTLNEFYFRTSTNNPNSVELWVKQISPSQPIRPRFEPSLTFCIPKQSLIVSQLIQFINSKLKCHENWEIWWKIRGEGIWRWRGRCYCGGDDWWWHCVSCRLESILIQRSFRTKTSHVLVLLIWIFIINLSSAELHFPITARESSTTGGETRRKISSARRLPGTTLLGYELQFSFDWVAVVKPPRENPFRSKLGLSIPAIWRRHKTGSQDKLTRVVLFSMMFRWWFKFKRASKFLVVPDGP